jgi:hypothetical protein
MPVGVQEGLLKHVLGKLGAAAELAAREAQQLGAVRIYERSKLVALAGSAECGLPLYGPPASAAGVLCGSAVPGGWSSSDRSMLGETRSACKGCATHRRLLAPQRAAHTRPQGRD